MQIDNFVIFDSEGHGKSVKGTKKTTGMQVRQYMRNGGYMCLKTVSYPVGDSGKREKAIDKCKKYIEGFTA